MDSPIAILERMHENKTEPSERGGADRIDLFLLDACDHAHPSIHQGRNVFWSGANKMNDLNVAGARFRHVILPRAPILLRVTSIDDCILQLYESSFARSIKFGGVRRAVRTNRSVRSEVGFSPSIAKEDFVSFVKR